MSEQLVKRLRANTDPGGCDLHNAADRIEELEVALRKAQEALNHASAALVFMRVKGSVAIAGFVRDSKERTPVVEMLDRIDDSIVVVRAAIAEIEKVLWEP